MNHSNISNGTKLPTIAPFPAIPLPKLCGISMAFFSTVGIIANGLVLIVMFVSKKRAFSTYKYLISHLAFADFLCAAMHLVYVPVELNKHNWVLPDFACKFVYPSITFFEMLAIGTIMIISFERYKGVILPHWASLKKRNICFALFVVWVAGLILVIPNIYIIKVTKYKNIRYCNELWGEKPINKAWQKTYGILFFMIAFFIPAIAVAIMHAHIMCRLNGREIRPTNGSRQRERSDNRIIRVLTGIIIVFFICTSPNKILYLVWDIFPEQEKDLTSHTRYYLRTFQVLYFARVAVDPLVYVFCDTRFRQDLKNTTQTVRGNRTATDSDSSRSRTRTLSTQPPNTDPVSWPSATVIANHQAASDNCVRYNGLTNGVDILSQSSLTVIQEATALNLPIPGETTVVSNGKRSRTESIATDRTTLYGSQSPTLGSPLGLSTSLMTEL